MKPVSAALELLAGLVLLGAIVVAPWMISPLGDTDTTRLELALATGVGIWIVSVVVALRRPRVPVTLVALVVLVLAWGTLMTLNGRARYDVATHAVVAVIRPITWLPGSVDRTASAHTLIQIGVVLIATLVLIDLARWQEMRPVALWMIAINGAAVGAVGAIGRVTHHTWFQHASRQGGTPFAAFGNHGNAAAYIDLVLPAALVLVAAGRRTRGARLIALGLCALILAGAATQASKAGLAAAVAIVLVFALVTTRRATGVSARERSALRFAALGLIVVIAGAGAILSRNRWSELPSELTIHGGRADVWHVAYDVWDEHRLTGSGPGSFKILLPGVTATREPQLFRNWIVSDYVPGQPVTIWMVADNDPLQTLAEWGVIGALFFGSILLFPVVRSLRLRTDHQFDGALRFGGVLALSVLYVHSLIDFPLQVLAIQMIAGLWAAMLIGGSKSTSDREPRAEPRNRRHARAMRRYRREMLSRDAPWSR